MANILHKNTNNFNITKHKMLQCRSVWIYYTHITPNICDIKKHTNMTCTLKNIIFFNLKHQAFNSSKRKSQITQHKLICFTYIPYRLIISTSPLIRAQSTIVSWSFLFLYVQPVFQQYVLLKQTLRDCENLYYGSFISWFYSLVFLK